MKSLNKSLPLLLLGFLSGCGSMTTRQPEPGRALIDATPEKEKRDRIDGIRIVSVNGRAVRGTECSLNPGRNCVRLGFNWPQGGRQELDLRFHAVAGHVYFVQYHVHPPYVDRLKQTSRWDERSRRFGDAVDEAAMVFAPLFLAWGGANTVEKATSQARELSKPAEYVDVMVVAKNSPEGIVRRVRAYPDGRVEAESWAACARMGHP